MLKVKIKRKKKPKSKRPECWNQEKKLYPWNQYITYHKKKKKQLRRIILKINFILKDKIKKKTLVIERWN